MAGRLVDYMGSGLASALPTAATVDGDLTAGAAGFYYATDTSVLYSLNRSGTPVWEKVTGNITTPPAVADFSWVNQGTTTAVDVDAGIFVTADPDEEHHILEMVAPSAPFDVYVEFVPMTMDATFAAFALTQGAIILRDNTGGDFLALQTEERRTSGDIYAMLQLARWTNPTTASTVPFVRYLNRYSPWIRANVTSTTVTFYIALEGHWIQLTTESIATFVGTIDRVGFSIRAGAVTDNSYCMVKNFTFTDPFA